MALSISQLVDGVSRDRFDLVVVSCEEGPLTFRLRDTEHECHILGTGWPPRMRQLVGSKVQSRWASYIKMPLWFLRTTLSLARYIRTKKIRLVHTNYYHFNIVAGLVSRLTRCKCIWHWHAPLQHICNPNITRSGRRLSGNIRWILLRRITRVLQCLNRGLVWSIANSMTTYDSIKPLVGDRLTMVYNGISIDQDPIRTNKELHQILGLSEDVRIVGLVGSLLRIKGHLYFLEAAARICQSRNDVHFVYIGGQTAAGQQDYLNFLLLKRQKLSLEERVHFMGHRPDAVSLMKDFDILTVCTVPPGEGFGFVIIEAMSMCVPVVATNVGAAREILTNGKSGILVPAADSEALAKEVESLLEDDKRRREIGSFGYRVCREKFDLKKTIQQVEAIYDIILGG
jgi:glycosyltransferase involved in cell wall biosynthesis